MKKIFISLFVIALTSTFIGCEQKEEALPPALTVTLMKFKEPSYVNHLIVTDYSNCKDFLLMRGNNCSAGYLYYFSGKDWTYDFPSLDDRTPYIALSDGWYLVDWPWYQYPFGGQVLLTEVTWDNYKGEWLFDKSSPHISNNIYEKIEIRMLDLVVYANPDGNYPEYTYRYTGSNHKENMNEYRYFEHLIGGEASTWGFLERDEDCLCSRAEEADSLWDLIRTQLNTLIQNGDLYSIPKATKEQEYTLKQH